MSKEQMTALRLWIEHCLAHNGETTLGWSEFRALQKAWMLPKAAYDWTEYGVMARRAS